jgi:hypothetical protein
VIGTVDNVTDAANAECLIGDKVAAFIAAARASAVDGLTWAEFGQLLVALLHLVVSGLDTVASMTGPQKRDFSIAAAAALFDTFSDRCVPIVAYPVWLAIRPAIRLLVLSLSAGAVESLLRISRSAAA